MARKPARKAGGRKSSSGRKAVSKKARTTTKASRTRAVKRKGKRPTPTRSAKTRARKAARPATKRTSVKARKPAPKRRGGTGREETLAQTEATGRSVVGPTNPMPTKRSTGTAAGAGTTRRAPGLERERKRLREIEETVQGPPSSLDMDRRASAARTGRETLRHAREEHTETSPALTGGDVDADWEDAYAVGDEAPGGDNPTPGQDRVDDIGHALGIEYQDNEELKGADKVADRDKHRWELDPASSEDYKERD